MHTLLSVHKVTNSVSHSLSQQHIASHLLKVRLQLQSDFIPHPLSVPS